MTIDKNLFNKLFEQAEKSERKRMNFDMRSSSEDKSQRMLNALLPGTEVAVHRHPMSSENVLCLCGRMDEVVYEEVCELIHDDSVFEKGMDAMEHTCRKVLREMERIHLDPSNGAYGCIVPAGVWHSVEVFEYSIIYESKDGKYGEDGSERYKGVVASTLDTPKAESFQNSLGDLKKNIEYLISMERQ